MSTLCSLHTRIYLSLPGVFFHVRLMPAYTYLPFLTRRVLSRPPDACIHVSTFPYPACSFTSASCLLWNVEYINVTFSPMPDVCIFEKLKWNERGRERQRQTDRQIDRQRQRQILTFTKNYTFRTRRRQKTLLRQEKCWTCSPFAGTACKYLNWIAGCPLEQKGRNGRKGHVHFEIWCTVSITVACFGHRN